MKNYIGKACNNMPMPKEQSKYIGLTYLPILEYVETLFDKSHLKDTYLIACQHVLPSTHMMIRSMVNLGLDLEKTAIIGKCYSSDLATMENMRNEGIFVCNSSIEFDSDLSFDKQFKSYVRSFLHNQLRRMNPKPNDRIIILDDGGVLITEAQSMADYYTNVIGVEQTSSGSRFLSTLNLKFPVVNIAQSAAKLNFESPLIAKSFVANLENRIKISSLPSQEVLIIGKGAIGSAVYQELKNNLSHHNVFAYDQIAAISEINSLELSCYDLIIGATGNRAVDFSHYENLKPEVVLASVSSSDREFDAVSFRKLSGKKWGIHDDVYYGQKRLLNAGFPLNFSGGKGASVPLLQIQFVCALLFLGVCNSIENNPQFNSNFVNLNEKVVEDLRNSFI